jgi:cathepsin C
VESCGHEVPDNPFSSFAALASDFKVFAKYNITLHSDYTVSDSENSRKEGTWTMIYDEGFEVNYKHLQLLAFSFY